VGKGAGGTEPDGGISARGRANVRNSVIAAAGEMPTTFVQNGNVRGHAQTEEGLIPTTESTAEAVRMTTLKEGGIAVGDIAAVLGHRRNRRLRGVHAGNHMTIMNPIEIIKFRTTRIKLCTLL